MTLFGSQKPNDEYNITEHERMKKSKRGTIVLLATIFLALLLASMTFLVLSEKSNLRVFGIGGLFFILQKAEFFACVITAAAFCGTYIPNVGKYMDPDFASLRTFLKVGAIALVLTFLRGGIEANKGDLMSSGEVKIFGDAFHVPIKNYLDIRGARQTYKKPQPNSDVEVIWVVVPNKGNDARWLIKSAAEPILILRYHGKKLVSLVKGFSVHEHMEWLLTGNNYNGSIGNFISRTKDTQKPVALESAFYLGDWEDRSLFSYIDDNFSNDSAACESEVSNDVEPSDALHRDYCSALQKSGSLTPAVNGTFLKGMLYLNSKGLGLTE